MSHLDDWLKANPTEARRLTTQAVLAKASRPTTPDDDDPLLTKEASGMDTRPSPATQEMLERITKRQADAPTLTYEQASAAVLREDPEIYQAYLDEQRQHQPRQRPVEKGDTPTRETIEKMVDDQIFQRPTLTRMDAWEQVLTKHQGQADFGAVYEAYRRYQLSAAALQDHDEARGRS
jgi:hypothetical protein